LTLFLVRLRDETAISHYTISNQNLKKKTGKNIRDENHAVALPRDRRSLATRLANKVKHGIENSMQIH
jgi:hypothetical protein